MIFMLALTQIICSKKLHFWKKGEMVMGNFTGAILVSLVKSTNSDIPFDIKRDFFSHPILILANGILILVLLSIFPILKKMFGNDRLSKGLYFMVATLISVLMYFIDVILFKYF